MFTDASLIGYGIYIEILSQKFAISGAFPKSTSDWSINVKELYVLLLGQFITIYIHKKLDLQNYSNKKQIVMSYVDNNTAKTISATLRPNLKSKPLGLLSKVQIALDLNYSNYINRFIRIPTKMNKIADILSRDEKFFYIDESTFYSTSPLLLIGVNLKEHKF